MKKSTIRILTILMAITFASLLYIEIKYMDDMIEMSERQFELGVRRSLHGVARRLENDETQYFLEQNNVSEIEASLSHKRFGHQSGLISGVRYNFQGPNGFEGQLTIRGAADVLSRLQESHSNALDRSNDINRIENDILGDESQFHRNVIETVILNLSSQASSRPLLERADTAMVRRYIGQELDNVGMGEVPFEFAIINRNNMLIFSTPDFVDEPDLNNSRSSYIQPLFPNDPEQEKVALKVFFPSKEKYVLKAIYRLIPAFIFSIILLVVFVYTIILAFRQKKINEMKSDFINNMTHEFKTPISTISLAAQMLNDDSVRKSPAMLQHISQVINEETKRLRFQVEKVLQMSMFDSKEATIRLQEVDANVAIANIINTFKLKVEKYGGTLTSNLDAENAVVLVDEMHFTNVIFNLLDNAVKYRREDTPLQLNISTEDISNDRLQIVVADNGIGIKKEQLKKIFEKFYRVPTGNTHNVKGFGLGLAYVKKMITILRGTIKVESEPGHGTKFIIELPLT